MADTKGYKSAYSAFTKGWDAETATRAEIFEKNKKALSSRSFPSAEAYAEAMDDLVRSEKIWHEMRAKEYEEKTTNLRKAYEVSPTEAAVIEKAVDKENGSEGVQRGSQASTEEEQELSPSAKAYQEDFKVIHADRIQQEEKVWNEYNENLEKINKQYPEGSPERDKKIEALDEGRDRALEGIDENFEEARSKAREKHNISEEDALPIEERITKEQQDNKEKAEVAQQDKNSYTEEYREELDKLQNAQKESRGAFHSSLQEIKNDPDLSKEEKAKKIAELNQEHTKDVNASRKAFKEKVKELRETYGISEGEAKAIAEQVEKESKEKNKEQQEQKAEGKEGSKEPDKTPSSSQSTESEENKPSPGNKNLNTQNSQDATTKQIGKTTRDGEDVYAQAKAAVGDKQYAYTAADIGDKSAISRGEKTETHVARA